MPTTKNRDDVKSIMLTAVALTLTLSGCAATDSQSSPAATESSPEDLLANHGLAKMDAVEVIDHLDRLELADRPTDLMGSVYPDELVLTDKSQEVTLDLPADSSYLSIAPYVNQTHDCFYHSLTTCQGELGNESVDVRIVDAGSGEVVVDEKATTFDNGFVGVWVPSDIEGTIEVSYDGMVGTTDFSTSDDGATCITDLQVA